MPSRAAIYCRISSDPDETRLGVARQEADCRQVAERKGWPVVIVLVDNDLSATGTKERPAYQRLLGAIEDGAVDAVIVWDLDRLHRRPIELEEFFAACDKAGVRHLASVGGDVDLSSGEGVLVARIKGAVAAEEARKVSVRARRKKNELAERGLPSGGGRRPFGYAADRVTIVEEEADAVRYAAARVLSGVPLGAIVRDLNQDGPPPVGGNVWRTNAVKKTLTAPRTAGLREHRGEVVGDAAWPGILDRSTWEQVRAVLTDPTRRTNAEPRKHLLSGITRCGRCGFRMSGKPKRTGSPAYACPIDRGGCSRTMIDAVGLEEVVVDAVLTVFDDATLEPKLGPAEAVDDVGAQVVELEHRMSELAEMFAAGEIGRREWVAARRPLEARLDAARGRQARAGRSNAVSPYAGRPGALRAAWASLGFEERRAVVAAVVDRIEIGPAVKGRNKFDSERVTVTWRA